MAARFGQKKQLSRKGAKTQRFFNPLAVMPLT
jgi:hypothetical protein